jgi:PAS domain S-box-containing protein
MVGSIAAARSRGEALQALLEAQPVPIYLTDAEGWVTAFNRACTDFAGRKPVPGQDRWCVTWRLHTEGGAFLPHEECPMAVAIREGRKVRGAVAVAERPDGTRVLFTPYPTPMFDEAGEVTGAVNILLDLTDRRQASALKAQAQRCRRLAQSVTDTQTVATLQAMAVEYDEKARSLVLS